MLLDSDVSVRCLLIYTGWILSLALIMVGWYFEVAGLRCFGIYVCAVAAVLSVIRDNQRTRRAIARGMATAQRRDL